MSRPQPRVGIAIPSFNAEAFIGETIRSLREQTFEDWIAVVVDDGSADETLSTAKKAADGDDRFIFLRQDNGGRPTACNRGERELPESCEYVAFVDADDVCEPEFLQTLVDYLDQHPSVDAAACQFVRINTRGRFFDSVYLNREHRHRTRWVPGKWGLPHDLGPDEQYTPLVTFLSCTGTGPWTLIRRTAFREIEGFDERLRARQDTDFYCRLSLGHAVHYLPDVLYRYRLHGGNITNDRKRNGASVDFLRNKWKEYRAKDAAAERELQLSRKYVDSVHRPLRRVRGGVREISKSRFRNGRQFIFGVSELSIGLSRFIVQYPLYMIRWHRPLQSVIRDRDAASRLHPAREASGVCATPPRELASATSES